MEVGNHALELVLAAAAKADETTTGDELNRFRPLSTEVFLLAVIAERVDDAIQELRVIEDHLRRLADK